MTGGSKAGGGVTGGSTVVGSMTGGSPAGTLVSARA
jgi:hypothetical protein